MTDRAMPAFLSESVFGIISSTGLSPHDQIAIGTTVLSLLIAGAEPKLPEKAVDDILALVKRSVARIHAGEYTNI